MTITFSSSQLHIYLVTSLSPTFHYINSSPISNHFIHPFCIHNSFLYTVCHIYIRQNNLWCIALHSIVSLTRERKFKELGSEKLHVNDDRGQRERVRQSEGLQCWSPPKDCKRGSACHPLIIARTVATIITTVTTVDREIFRYRWIFVGTLTDKNKNANISNIKIIRY